MQWLWCWFGLHLFQDVDYSIEDDACLQECSNCAKVDRISLQPIKKNLLISIANLQSQKLELEAQIQESKTEIERYKQMSKHRSTLWCDGQEVSADEYRLWLNNRVREQIINDWSLPTDKKEALLKKLSAEKR